MADGWRREARQIARQEGVDPKLFAALIQQESGWKHNRTSPAGAYGFTQLMPGTAQGLGVDPRDPRQNLRGGARYLRQQLDKFGSVKLALAAYNAGPGNVEKYGGIPPFSETQNYVRTILGNYRGGDGRAAAPSRRARPPRGRAGGGAPGVPAITLYGIGGDPAASGSSPLDSALSMLRGESTPLQFAMAMLQADAQQPETVVLPGSKGAPGGAAPRNRGSSGGGRRASQGGDPVRILTDISRRVQEGTRVNAPSGMRTRRENAAVGGSPTSDHLSDDQAESWARDYGTTDRREQAKAARIWANRLGIKLNGSFTSAETKIGGRRARVQLIYGAENDHGDHLHVGIRWLD